MAWNRSSGAPKVAPKKSPSAMHGIVAGLVVVCALGGLCLWMFSGGDDAAKDKTAKGRGLIREVTPAAAPKTKPLKDATKKEPQLQQEKVVEPKIEKTEADDDELPPLPKNCVADFRVRKKDRKPLFDDPVQSQLQEFVVPGRDTPPPDRVTDQQALEACIYGVKFLETDTEEQRAIKESVKGLLDELRDWLKQGRHANEFFEKLYQRQEMEHETVQAAREGVMSVAEEGDAENTKDAMKAYNKYLQEKGLPPVKIFKLRHLESEIENEQLKEENKE